MQRYASYLVESVPKAKAVQTHFVADYPNCTLKRDLLCYICIIDILFHTVRCSFLYLIGTYWPFVISAKVRQTRCHPDLV